MSSDSEEEVLYEGSHGYFALRNGAVKGKGDRKSLLDDSKRTSGIVAVFSNLFKCYTGAGILSLPFAFRYSGILAGIISLVGVSVLCTVSMICLVQCKRKLCQTHTSNLSYSDVVLLLLGRRWSVVLDCVITAFQFGAVIIYFVFVSENITPFLSSKMSPGIARLAWMGFIAPFYIGLSWIRSMKYVGIISFFAEICILAGLVLSSVIGVVQISEETVPGLALNVQISPPWRTLPLMFGMAAFAFEGAGVVIPTESSMKQPEKFNKVLVFVLVCATFMYIAFGVLLYLAFGPQTGLSTGQITENLEQFANHRADKAFWHFIQSLVRFCLVAGIGMSVTVQLIVVLDIFEKELFKPGRLSTNNIYWKENIIRAIVTLIGLALAASGLSFGHMVSLTGAFSGTLMQFIFPCACYLKCFESELSKVEKVAVWGMAVVGGIFGALATYVTLVEIFS